MGETISFSELSSYMQCPRKHFHAYEERLHKNSYSQSSRMNIGIVVHECLESALKEYVLKDYSVGFETIYDVMKKKVGVYDSLNRPKLQEFFDGEKYITTGEDEQEQWDADLDTALKIAQRTIMHLNIPENWEIIGIQWGGEYVPLIEFKFEYPIVNDTLMVGKIDLVARNREDNLVYLFDWKTKKAFSDDFEIGAEDMNLQMSIYQYVLNSLGVNIFGTITYQIRSTVPQKPATKLDGKMSRANITTDWETYKAALLENGENPDDYVDMRMKIQPEQYWWLPITVIRGRIELQNRWNTAKEIASKMLDEQTHSKYESQQCAFCPYFRLCLGEDRGLDVQNIKETLYNTEARI